jgi:hypothetical protein
MKASNSANRFSSSIGIAGIAFLVAGILSFVLAFFVDSQVLGLIGLGLTFWGALFLSIGSSGFMEGGLLESVAVPVYKTIDRALQDSKTAEKAYYIPSYPKDVYLPNYLKGLKETVVFIPTTESSGMPALEEIAAGRINVVNPAGILVTPPGAELLALFESKTRIDLSKMRVEEFVESFPKLLLETVNVAKEIMLVQEQNQIKLTVVDSPFLKLFGRENNLRSVGLLGCPIASVTACAIAKVVGKRVTISSLKVIAELKTMHVTYSMLEG